MGEQRMLKFVLVGRDMPVKRGSEEKQITVQLGKGL